ncbi:MAG: dephospho-CoA kinase [Rhodobacteraceae bacterium]|nr:dephospho-CoA kinase [Paracoccaceae bacterium]
MSRPRVIGLTGSIGMGKTTTAAMFAEAGLPVWDADAAVHRLYGPGGAALGPVGALCPEAVTLEGIDRARLRDWIARTEGALARLEAVVHPLVAADREEFLARAAREGADLAVVDIPLLFETGAEDGVDVTVVVSAPEEVQRARVLARPGMEAGHLSRIMARQMPDAEKRARADHVIETDGMERARAQVRDLVARLRSARDA